MLTYEHGLTSYDEWEKLEGELAIFEQTLLNSSLDLMIRQAEWERLTGVSAIP